MTVVILMSYVSVTKIVFDVKFEFAIMTQLNWSTITIDAITAIIY